MEGLEKGMGIVKGIVRRGMERILVWFGNDWRRVVEGLVIEQIKRHMILN